MSNTSCPSCGTATVRKLTEAELRERTGSPFAVVMPRLCEGCGHVWTPRLSSGMCYAVSAVGAAGVLAGFVGFFGAIWLLFFDDQNLLGGLNGVRNPTGIATVGVLALGLVFISATMCRKYLHLAKRR